VKLVTDEIAPFLAELGLLNRSTSAGHLMSTFKEARVLSRPYFGGKSPRKNVNPREFGRSTPFYMYNASGKVVNVL